MRPGMVKTYTLDGPRLTVTWQLTGLAGRRLATRLDLAMPSCDGVLGHYLLADGSIAGGFGQPLVLPAAHRLTLVDGVLGGRLQLHSSLAAGIECRAHQTVSQSEAGFEKIMQSAELQLFWEIPDDACSLQLQLTMESDQP
jgi:alpha-amylase